MVRFDLEDIEGMRRSRGIDDLELRGAVAALKRGDRVHITLLPGGDPPRGERVAVRITSVRDGSFRGKVLACPATPSLSGVELGPPVPFTAAHIHSLAAKPPAGRTAPQPAPTPRTAITPRTAMTPHKLTPPAGPDWPGEPFRFGGLAPRPATTAERLRRIEEMGRRVAEYVRFMCLAGDLKGVSSEERDRAVADFYDQLATAERHLGRTHDALKLS